MSLYVCTQSVYPNSSTYKHFHKLYLTNDPASYFPDNASSFVEYEPNMSSFPSFDGLDVVRNNVISVEFNNDELTIKLPEDCSGLFRNLHLGQPDMNSYGWYGDSTPGDFYSNIRNIVLDLSRFDTSDVKNMSSMFENCIGDRWYTFTSGSGSGGTYSRWHGFGNFQLSGLDAWDVSNVENVSRMFASINISKMFDHGPCYERFSYAIEPFVSGGLHNGEFTKVTDATNMFANSTFNIDGMNIKFTNTNCDYSFMFSNFKTKFTYYSGSHRYTAVGGNANNSLDLSEGNFTGNGSNFSSMFRNTGLTSIYMKSTLNRAISTLASGTAINYMFANDGASNVGVLKKIQATPGTDGKILNPNLSGYKMFVNDTGLPNFNSSNNNIDYANNTKTTGYFDQSPPEKQDEIWFYTRNGGKTVEAWFKTDDGGKESEVYF